MRRALDRALAAIYAALPGLKRGTITRETLIAKRGEVGSAINGPMPTMEALRLLAFERTLEDAGFPDPTLAAQITAGYLEQRFANVDLYPDTLPMLQALHGRYRLGLASNGNSYPERSGLAGHFAFVVLAEEVGYKKPASGFYRALLERAGAEADTLLHVGDKLVEDVAGAQDAGLRAIWLNRNGIANTTGVQPDRIIRSLDELPALLADWSQGSD